MFLERRKKAIAEHLPVEIAMPETKVYFTSKKTQMRFIIYLNPNILEDDAEYPLTINYAIKDLEKANADEFFVSIDKEHLKLAMDQEVT